MATDIDELTISYEEEGIELVKELDKAVLSKGAWATLVYRYQDWDRKAEAYGPEKYTIRRYRKVHGNYAQQSKFNISSRAQAEKIVEILVNWLKVAE